MNDLFSTSNSRFYADVPEENFSSHLSIDDGVRTIQLTYSRSFGNKKLRAVDIKTGSEEERRRVR